MSETLHDRLHAAFIEGFHAGANMAGTLSAEECWSASNTKAALRADPAPLGVPAPTSGLPRRLADWADSSRFTAEERALLQEAAGDPCPICGTNRGGGDCPKCYSEDYEDQAIVEAKPIV